MTTPQPAPARAADSDVHAPRRFADQRGIALQTVVIMVVLLAIAGSVAAVLLTRAAETTEQLDRQENVYQRADTFAECELIGGRSSKAAATAAFSAAASDGSDFMSCHPPA